MSEYKKKSKPAKVEIVGRFIRTRLHNYKDGYTIFEIEHEGKAVTCVGYVLAPKAQTRVIVKGYWKETKEHGKQLADCTLRELLVDADSIFQYLKKIRGVGDATAYAVAYKLDIDLTTLCQKSDASDYLKAKTGINRNAADAIVDYIKTNSAKTMLFELLSKFDASAYALTTKMMAAFGAGAYLNLITDPYQIGTRCGLKFSSCDAIARLTGANMEDEPKRVVAAAEYYLRLAGNEGDTCRPLSDVTDVLRSMLGKIDSQQSYRHSISTVMIAHALYNNEQRLFINDDQLYSRSMYWMEERAAYALKRIVRSGIKAQYNVNELCDYAESVCGVKYAEQQREAFRAFLTGGLCVLTGGPGTGKTTVVKGLLAAYEKLFPDNIIKLCAPTGRAAQRMKEATGREATTIHRLLEYRPYGDSFACKNEADPIEADLIVVDESSMISIDIAELFFSAVKSGTMVLLVGDTDQLPSVGPGAVLADIIASGIAPVFALTKTYRQGSGSPIIINAHKISEGDHHLVTGKDFVILESDTTNIEMAVRNQYVQYHKANDPFAVQVLTMTKQRRDPNSSVNLSRIIQAQVNPRKTGGLRYGDNIYFPGDKIMMLSNNYNIGYFNGDVGIVKSVGPNEVVVTINGSEVHVPTSMLDDMSLSYACTIHKSQGSEYDVCIVVLTDEHISMLQRNILYTAITRAKKRVILITSEQAVFASVNNVKAMRRMTRLKQRLQAKSTENIDILYSGKEAPAPCNYKVS